MGRSLASEPPPKVRRTEPVSADDDENDIDVVATAGMICLHTCQKL